MRRDTRTVLRVFLCSAAVLPLGLGCLAGFALVALGPSSQLFNDLAFAPALPVAYVLDGLGVGPTDWLVTIHDGWPMLTPAGTLVVYLAPGVALLLTSFLLRGGVGGQQNGAN
jgi:hypothetical protein